MNTDAALRHGGHRGAVIDLLRLHGPLPRAELARRLDLSAATLTRVVDSLLADRLVERVASECRAEGSHRRAGRPGELVAFRGSAYAVVAVDVGGTKMFGAVSDLAGTIECERYVRHEARGERAVEALCEMIGGLLAAPRPAGQPVRGIGVGAPGVTRAAEGVVTFAPALGWRDVPLAAILTDRFGLPAFVENDANLAALGEVGYGAAQGCRNAVCVAIGTGLGAGIIIDGQLCRGHTHSAGEVGYMIPGVEHLGLRPEGFGIYESLASGSAIAERGRRLAAEGVGAGFPRTGSTQAGQGDPAPTVSAEDVFVAARDGVGWAVQAVAETVDLLSLGVANIAGLLDPEVIVFGGGVARSADLLLEPIRRRLDGALPELPRLAVSPLGYRAGVLGAVKLVVDSLAVG